MAQALEAWHKAGAAAGDIAFWRKHVEAFTSPKAYALVVEALLDAGDFMAAMALLMQWLSQAGPIAAGAGGVLVPLCWPAAGWPRPARRSRTGRRMPGGRSAQTLVRKFFDVLEANAEDFWQVPRLESDRAGSAGRARPPTTKNCPGRGTARLYAAAYDEMVYVDSTGRRRRGRHARSRSRPGRRPTTNWSWKPGGVRERLAFLGTVSQLWKTAALGCGSPAAGTATPLHDEVLGALARPRPDTITSRLLELLASMDVKPVEPTSASRDALLEYERRRSIKEVLLDAAIATAVDTVDAQQVLRSLLQPASQTFETGPIDVVCRAVLAGEPRRGPRALACVSGDARKATAALRFAGPGGDPREIVAARGLQPMLRDLARAAPAGTAARNLPDCWKRPGTWRTTHVCGRRGQRVRSAVRSRLQGAGRKRGRACPARLAGSPEDRERGRELADADLVDVLEQLTESLLKQWLAHSRTLRLSVLEKIGDEKTWQALVEFIERYGHDLLMQRFLNFGNLRAILHQGVEDWLDRLAARIRRPPTNCWWLRDLGGGTCRGPKRSST